MCKYNEILNRDIEDGVKGGRFKVKPDYKHSSVYDTVMEDEVVAQDPLPYKRDDAFVSPELAENVGDIEEILEG